MFLYLFILGEACIPEHACGGQRKICWSETSLPTKQVPGINWSQQAWQQVPLPAKPSCWPITQKICFEYQLYTRPSSGTGGILQIMSVLMGHVLWERRGTEVDIELEWHVFFEERGTGKQGSHRMELEKTGSYGS